MGRWTARHAVLAIVAVVAPLAIIAGEGCAGVVPWGAGGPDLAVPEGALAGALVRNFGEKALGRASERLALTTRDVLAAGLGLPEHTTLARPADAGWGLEWQGLALAGGAVELAVADGRLVARMAVPEQDAALAFVSEQDASYRCDFDAVIGPGTLTVPLGFAVDKLGRIGGQVLGDATWSGPIVTPTALTCVEDPVRAVGDGLAATAPGALAPVLGPQLGSALELGYAFGGASAVASDTTGAGVLRLAVRGDEAAPATFDSAGMTLAWAVGVEAEAHPCMAPGALPAVPRPAVAAPTLPDGATALRLGALERVLQAAWLAGAACGDHALGAAQATETAGQMAGAWDALGRLESASALYLELWPTALPTLAVSPEGELVVSTGPLEVSLWGAIDQASWRLATMQVTIVVTGQLARDTLGHLSFAASRTEVTPLGVTGGLIGTPPLGVVAALVEPLAEALVAGQTIVVLPPVLAPVTPDVLVIVPSATGDDGDAWIVFPP